MTHYCVYCNTSLNPDIEQIYYIWAFDGYSCEACYIEAIDREAKEFAQKMSKKIYQEK